MPGRATRFPARGEGRISVVWPQAPAFHLEEVGLTKVTKFNCQISLNLLEQLVSLRQAYQLPGDGPRIVAFSVRPTDNEMNPKPTHGHEQFMARSATKL